MVAEPLFGCQVLLKCTTKGSGAPVAHRGSSSGRWTRGNVGQRGSESGWAVRAGSSSDSKRVQEEPHGS